MDYIVEIANGNPRILAVQEDGTYRAIATINGDNALDSAKQMVSLANGRRERLVNDDH